MWKAALFLHTQLTGFCLPPPPPFIFFRLEFPLLVYLFLKWLRLLSSPNLLTLSWFFPSPYLISSRGFWTPKVALVNRFVYLFICLGCLGVCIGWWEYPVTCISLH